VKRIEDIAWESSNHHNVSRKVLYRQDSCQSNITQVAYTELLKGDLIGLHYHPTMEEIFLVTNGVCEFIINDERFLAETNSVVRIPANTNHALKAISNCSLFYIGVSI
jgi:quercetin dioxygenase-like cupin family protein